MRPPTEDELRAEFERQHSGRNLKRNRNNNYLHTGVQICWRQHQRTVRWMAERLYRQETNAMQEVVLGDMGLPVGVEEAVMIRAARGRSS